MLNELYHLSVVLKGVVPTPDEHDKLRNLPSVSGRFTSPGGVKRG